MEDGKEKKEIIKKKKNTKQLYEEKNRGEETISFPSLG
jgi:hypothetical protein